MTYLYGAEGSFVLPRPKKKVKPLTQSPENRICMGKWPVPHGAVLSLRLQKGPRRSDFSGAPFATNAIPEKIEHERTRGRGRKNNKLGSRGPILPIFG